MSARTNFEHGASTFGVGAFLFYRKDFVTLKNKNFSYKTKTLREDAYSREDVVCRKRTLFYVYILAKF